MLLVTIGYRRKGGVSKARVGEILGLDASSYLDDLLSFGLIYCDPSRELNFWRPTPPPGKRENGPPKNRKAADASSENSQSAQAYISCATRVTR